MRLGYSKLLGEVKSGTVDFTNPELHLVPRLRSLDKSRYGLRDDGGPDAILEFEEADEDPDVTGTAEVPTDDSISVEIPKAVKKPAERTPVIEESVFPDFDYLGLEKATDGKGGEITRKTSCEEMKSAAQKLHTHHVEYLQRLNHHIESELSSYMGQSDENGEAVIKKRRVSIGTDAADGADYYTSYFTDGEKKEERIETVRSFSGKAYETMLSEYLNAFAARKVGLTDITSNIEKFNHKINGISEALRKKTAVLAGTAVFLLFAIRKLKDKYFHTWLVFQDESNKALTSNARAARELDELLKLHLPSLKQVYEYQLDVEFYYECYKLAKSKLAHHKNKLSERIQLIKLVLEDLEFSNDVGKAGITPFDFKMPELMLAFCAGDNPQIYAVLDKKILDLLNKKDGCVK